MSSYITVYVKNQKGQFAELTDYSRSSYGYGVFEAFVRFGDTNAINSTVLKDCIDRAERDIERYEQMIERENRKLEFVKNSSNSIKEKMDYIAESYGAIDEINESIDEIRSFISECYVFRNIAGCGRNEDRIWLGFESYDLEEKGENYNGEEETD